MERAESVKTLFVAGIILYIIGMVGVGFKMIEEYNQYMIKERKIGYGKQIWKGLSSEELKKIRGMERRLTEFPVNKMFDRKTERFYFANDKGERETLFPTKNGKGVEKFYTTF